MDKLVNFRNHNYCSYCNKESIELYDIFNKPMNYSKLLSNDNIDNILDIKQLLKFRCTNCNKEYNIIWKDHFPYPLKHNKEINYFLNRFMKVGKR